MNNDYSSLGLIVLLLALVYFMTSSKKEGFSEEGAIIENTTSLPSKYFDPRTGELKEGDGFIDPILGDGSVNRAGVPATYYYLDDGAEGRMSVQHNLCSRSCCASQYPTPHPIESDPYVLDNVQNFVPSNMMCNNAFQDAGCMCLTKEQGEFFQARGGNN
jgi:hypothetical protein